jgi:hypothetical protein
MFNAKGGFIHNITSPSWYNFDGVIIKTVTYDIPGGKTLDVTELKKY